MSTAAAVLQVAVAQNQFRRVARFNHDQGVAGRTCHEHLVGMEEPRPETVRAGADSISCVPEFDDGRVEEPRVNPPHLARNLLRKGWPRLRRTRRSP